MIKRIELVNFMSHCRTVIEPADGLTVLVGPNNCGKSAVVAALQVLAYNDPSKYVLRHDTRECSVRVVTTDDDGDGPASREHVIRWQRGKNKAPSYEINGVEFDRLRQKVPPELEQTLRINPVQCDSGPVDVHFGEQKSPVFLLNQSSRTAAEFFASSSDAAHLLEMQNLHQQRVRDARGEQKRLHEESAQIDSELQLLEPVDELLKKLTKCDKSFARLQRERTAIGSLEDDIRQLLKSELQGNWLSSLTAQFDELPEPPRVQPTAPLSALIEQITDATTLRTRLESQAGVLDRLADVPSFADEGPLAEMIRQRQTLDDRVAHWNQASQVAGQLVPPPEWISTEPLAALVDQLSQLDSQIENWTAETDCIHQQIMQTTAEMEAWVAVNPSCPVCGQQIEPRQLVLLAGQAQQAESDHDG